MSPPTAFRIPLGRPRYGARTGLEAAWPFSVLCPHLSYFGPVIPWLKERCFLNNLALKYHWKVISLI